MLQFTDDESGYFQSGDYFPLVIHAVRGHLRERHVAEAARLIEAPLARREPFVICTDARATESVDALYRKGIAEFSDGLEALTRRYCVGSVIIVSGGFARAALRAIQWIRRVSEPFEVVATPEEAARYVEDKWRGQERELTVRMELGLSHLRAETLRMVR